MKNNYLYGTGILLTFLVVSMPFCFAAEMSLTYDANGNLVTGDGKYRTYNSLNQLWKIYNGSNTSILLEEYTYDPIEERVLMKKSYNISGAWIETVVYVDKSFVQIKNLTGVYNITYIYQDGTLVAQINPDGSKYYFASDIKASIVAVTNASGAVIETNMYSPTGELLAGGNKSRYSYEGKENDKTIGWTDYNFRLYNPSAYIFGTPDTLIQNVYDAQFLNRYMFERGNPYRSVDSDGHVVIYVGLADQSGFGTGGGGAGGIVASYTFKDGFHYGGYTRYDGGIVTPSTGLNFEYGISPGMRTIKNLEGQSMDYGFDVGDLLTQGGGISIPNENNHLDWKDIAVGGTTGPFTKLNYNPFGLVWSAHAVESHTTVYEWGVPKVASQSNEVIKICYQTVSGGGSTSSSSGSSGGGYKNYLTSPVIIPPKTSRTIGCYCTLDGHEVCN